MPTDRVPAGSSTRRSVAIALMALGGLLLMIMPAILFFFSLSASKSAHLPGTLVILGSAGGMSLILIGAAIRE